MSMSHPEQTRQALDDIGYVSYLLNNITVVFRSYLPVRAALKTRTLLIFRSIN